MCNEFEHPATVFHGLRLAHQHSLACRSIGSTPSQSWSPLLPSSFDKRINFRVSDEIIPVTMANLLYEERTSPKLRHVGRRRSQVRRVRVECCSHWRGGGAREYLPAVSPSQYGQIIARTILPNYRQMKTLEWPLARPRHIRSSCNDLHRSDDVDHSGKQESATSRRYPAQVTSKLLFTEHKGSRTLSPKTPSHTKHLR